LEVYFIIDTGCFAFRGEFFRYIALHVLSNQNMSCQYRTLLIQRLYYEFVNMQLL
jgi:hypothetical protein